MGNVKPYVRVIEKGGWKHDENTRFGAVVVGFFETYNPQTKDVKTFQFAPTLEDLPVIRRMCELVEEVDKHNKAVYNLKMEAESLKVENKGCAL